VRIDCAGILVALYVITVQNGRKACDVRAEHCNLNIEIGAGLFERETQEWMDAKGNIDTMSVTKALSSCSALQYVPEMAE